MVETTKNKKHHGFTLVELIVVVLVLAIIAAVAAPKMFDVADDARESTAKQSLSVVRDAIELYRAANGEFPASGGKKGGAEDKLKDELSPYLTGPFPSVPEGIGSGKPDRIKVYDDATVLFGNGEDGSKKKNMWAYNRTTGELIINYNAVSLTGVPFDEL